MIEIELGGQTLRAKPSELKLIAKGGEGEIFHYSQGGRTLAIKRYFDPTDLRIDKIRNAIRVAPANAMFEAGGHTVIQLAWPMGIVSENARPVGFHMPYLRTDETLGLEYFTNLPLNKDPRHLHPPNIAVKCQIARNLCAVIETLHSAGHYFIDFKPENVRVYTRTQQVCLVDCDSYSILAQNGTRFPASAFSSEYISPVALVNGLHPRELGLEQDNWAIAVAIFKLLNIGIHPYSGVLSPDVLSETIDDNVKMGLYPYGSIKNSLVSPRPTSAHTSIPDDLRKYFDDAFSNSSSIPTMKQWVEIFDDHLNNKRFERCTNHPNDLAHVKFLGFSCQQCGILSGKKPNPFAKAIPKAAAPQISNASSSTLNSSLSNPRQKVNPRNSGFPDLKLLNWVGLVICFIFVMMIIANAIKPESPRTAVPVDLSAPGKPKPTAELQGPAQVLRIPDLLDSTFSTNCPTVQIRFESQSELQNVFLVTGGVKSPIEFTTVSGARLTLDAKGAGFRQNLTFDIVDQNHIKIIEWVITDLSNMNQEALVLEGMDVSGEDVREISLLRRCK